MCGQDFIADNIYVYIFLQNAFILFTYKAKQGKRCQF